MYLPCPPSAPNRSAVTVRPLDVQPALDITDRAALFHSHLRGITQMQGQYGVSRAPLYSSRLQASTHNTQHGGFLFVHFGSCQISQEPSVCFIHSREVRPIGLVLCVVLLATQLQPQCTACIVAATYLPPQASGHEKDFCLGTKPFHIVSQLSMENGERD